MLSNDPCYSIAYYMGSLGWPWLAATLTRSTGITTKLESHGARHLKSSNGHQGITWSKHKHVDQNWSLINILVTRSKAVTTWDSHSDSALGLGRGARAEDRDALALPGSVTLSRWLDWTISTPGLCLDGETSYCRRGVGRPRPGRRARPKLSKLRSCWLWDSRGKYVY